MLGKLSITSGVAYGNTYRVIHIIDLLSLERVVWNYQRTEFPEQSGDAPNCASKPEGDPTGS
jgi:hypothetical protein